LPILFASGLVSRPHRPSPPTISSGTISPGQKILSEKSAFVSGAKITALIVADPSKANGQELQLVTSSPLLGPDLLVYWSPQEPKAALASEARLLGPFPVLTHYSLPLEVQGKGFVSLYSLARGQVLVSLPVDIQP
jgi:hypothetical protein